MTENDEPPPGPQDTDRTVFIPSTPVTRAPGPPVDSGAAEGGPAQGDGPAASSWSPEPPAEPMWTPRPEAAAPPPSPPPSPGRVAVGSMLNDIYEVRRFIARGGMAEVYEGANVNTDERVAIKVILSHLTADANVQAMFRKEAQTLQRLQHPAVVQYRMLAQEPTLKLFYLVMEFIDGEPLGDQIGRYIPTGAQIQELTRRLASGLEAAHELGAIHRDLSPDNVLLPDGRLDRAKVIDFGIAKDLNPSSKTIVGDGFAGKLGYVAPEQFGDYDRAVGPWTDVYSLGLVILAFAGGKPVDMGVTLVEAIDKRRKGPDLSILPENLRPVFAGMLQADPKARFRSMAEVIAALDRVAPAGESRAAVNGPSPPKPPSDRAAAGRKGSGPPWPLLIGGGVGVAALIGLVLFLAAPKPHPAAAAADQTASAVATVSPADRVKSAVEAALPAASCTWLDIHDVGPDGGGVALTMTGIAGDPGAANAAVSKAAQATGVRVTTDTSHVLKADQAACRVLDAFRAFRVASATGVRSIESVQQEDYTIQANAPGCTPARAAKVTLHMRLGDPSSDFAVLGMLPNGQIQTVIPDRKAFDAYRAQDAASHGGLVKAINDGSSDAYELTLCYDTVGPGALVLLQGTPPFVTGAPDAPAQAEPAPGWESNFVAAGRTGRWRIGMAWFKVRS